MTARPSPFLSEPPGSALPRLSRVDAAVAGALVVATFFFFARTLGFGYINYDDPLYVVNQAHVLGGLTFANVKWAFTSVYAGNWHPLTWLSLMTDVSLFGAKPGVFHGGNAFFHALATGLLFLLLRRLSGTRWISAAVALSFGLHPLRAESVVWIAERKDTLCVMFLLLTFHAYFSYAQSRSRKWYAALIVCLVLALMAKAMAVTAPAILLLFDYWPLGRLTRVRWKSALLDKLLPIGLCAAVSIATFIAQRDSHAVNALAALPLEPRLANTINGYVIYLAQTLAPLKLGVYYPHPLMGDSSQLALSVTLPNLLLLCFISAALFLYRARAPHLLVGWLIYVGTLVPVIGLVQVGTQGHADRYAYLPHVGLCIAAAVELSRRDGALRRAFGPTLRVVFFVLLTCWTMLGWEQIGYWRSNESLMAHTNDVVPMNAMAKTVLAAEKLSQGRTDNSEALIREAIAVSPGDALAWSVLAGVDDARERHDAAVKAARHATLLAKTDGAYWMIYGRMVGRAGDKELALAALRRAVILDVQNGEDGAHSKALLASTLAEVGRYAEAISLWNEAIAKRPDVGNFHFGLGLALVVNGSPAAGIAQLQEAVRLELTSEAPMRLSWILSTYPDPSFRDGPAALRLANIAVERSTKPDPDLFDTLAAARARAGDWPGAIEAAGHAASLARAGGHESLAGRIEQRLELYRQYKPFPPVDLPATRATTSLAADVSVGR